MEEKDGWNDDTILGDGQVGVLVECKVRRAEYKFLWKAAAPWVCYDEKRLITVGRLRLAERLK